MVFKCCVTGCRGNYDVTKSVKVFRLPNKKNVDERKRWISAIPRENIPDNPNTFICEDHWPKDYEKILVYGKLRPKHPPSVFSCVNPSQIPTPRAPPRSTNKALPSLRNTVPDELEEFLKADKISSFEDLCYKIMSKTISFPFSIISNINANCLHLQSADTLENLGVPKFILKIKNDLSFDSYHCGVKCTIKPFSYNHMNIIDCFSRLHAAIHYLNSLPIDHKKSIIFEQMLSMNSLVFIGEKKYSPDMVARAFEYFSLSRTLYSRLRDDYELPSISLMTKLTSKVRNVEDNDFLKFYFEKCSIFQRQVILLIDEIYVKPQLTYQGGNIFGKSVNLPNELAKTVLGIMICSLFGGKQFLYKALPVTGLDANFQYDQTVQTIEKIKKCGGSVVAIICDNNKVNKKFFGMFNLRNNWCTNDNIFLLYDFVHLIKSIRNNWLTEKCQELFFTYKGVSRTAKWSDLKTLFQVEKDAIIKLSKLNETAIFPKPIERQNVSTCLRVFCDETLAALKTHPSMENVDDTTVFLSIFIKFFKIVNVKGRYEDICTRDKYRAVFSSNNDKRLNFLLNLAGMVEKMAPDKQGQRIKNLTKDTSRAFSHTCRGMVDLVKHLLITSHKYVCLGHFTSDPIEKAFGKLRQGSGGTYFINVQQILQKVDIKKTKLCLNIGIIVNDLEISSSHLCDKCNYVMQDDTLFNVFHNLPVIESNLSKEIKMCLVYIAGYVSREDPPCEDTSFCFDQFGEYVREINRGGLNFPGDNICHWIFYSYILFHHLYTFVCRVSLSKCFLMVSDFYGFTNVSKKHSRILANIFFNNYCHLYTPRSSKEPKLKVLKLS